MAKSLLILEKLSENHYRFNYPGFVQSLDDLIYNAIDLIEDEDYVSAKDILHTVIDAFPEHIDAHHYLAICIQEQGEFQVAFNTWQKAVDIGLDCFPKDATLADMKLEWGWLENRPFLRAYEALGIEYYEQERIEEALRIFNHLLTLNPNDNQGIRALAIKANFDLDRPEEVLKICEKYPQDILADTNYGRLLALYQLKSKEKIEPLLKKAINYLPVVAQELIKPHHDELEVLMEEFDQEKAEAMD